MPPSSRGFFAIGISFQNHRFNRFDGLSAAFRLFDGHFPLRAEQCMVKYTDFSVVSLEFILSQQDDFCFIHTSFMGIHKKNGIFCTPCTKRYRFVRITTKSSFYRVITIITAARISSRCTFLLTFPGASEGGTPGKYPRVAVEKSEAYRFRYFVNVNGG